MSPFGSFDCEKTEGGALPESWTGEPYGKKIHRSGHGAENPETDFYFGPSTLTYVVKLQSVFKEIKSEAFQTCKSFSMQ